MLNNSIKAKLAGGALIASMSLSLATPVLANHQTWSEGRDDTQQTGERQYNRRLNEAEARYAEVKAKIDTVSCNALEKRIDNKTDYYDRMYDTWRSRYEKHKNDLLAFADKLDTRGYDTSHFRESTNYLEDNLIAKADKDVAALKAKLDESQKYSCGNSEGKFRATVKESHSLLLVVHQDLLDIKEYYLEVIKADIKTVRQQKPNPSTN